MTASFMTALEYHRLLHTSLSSLSLPQNSDPPVSHAQNQQMTLPSPLPLSEDQIISLYERARFHKLYGITPINEEIPAHIWQMIRSRAVNDPHAVCEIEFSLFLQSDHFHPSSPALLDQFLRSAGQFLFENVPFRIHGNSAYKALVITTTQHHVEHLLRMAEFTHVIVINYLTLGDVIQVHTASPYFFQQIRQHNPIVHPTQSFPKAPHNTFFSPPDPNFLLRCVPAIYSWIHDRITTTIRTHKVGNTYELRYYRHSYTDGEKKPLIYTSPAEITHEISQGAFCWIPDAHRTLEPLEVESGESARFTGPIYATVDIDAGSSTSYSDMVAAARSFITFLHDSCHISPHFLTSGNRSLHLRFEVSCPTTDERGYLLPKITQWSTYARRRHSEFSVQTVRDALLILFCAYNDTHRSHPIGCDIPAYQRYKSRLFFDLRCGLHQGARVPGSYHHKSNRYCALIPKLFENELEVIPYSTQEYLETHPEALYHPEMSDADRHSNLIRLLSFTNEWYETHLSRLLEDHIFRGTWEGD